MVLSYLAANALKTAVDTVSPYVMQVGQHAIDKSNSIPVPDMPVYVLPFGLLAVLGASVWLLRKKNLNMPAIKDKD